MIVLTICLKVSVIHWFLLTGGEGGGGAAPGGHGGGQRDEVNSNSERSSPDMYSLQVVCVAVWRRIDPHNFFMICNSF
jgi:hypothetical protein